VNNTINLDIWALVFVIGAIFFALGLLGGGLKVKEAEIPPFSPVARTSLLAVGVVLLIICIGRLIRTEFLNSSSTTPTANSQVAQVAETPTVQLPTNPPPPTPTFTIVPTNEPTVTPTTPIPTNTPVPTQPRATVTKAATAIPTATPYAPKPEKIYGP